MTHHSTFTLGWDVGGAHLKNALYHPESKSLHTRQVATPLWQGHAILDHACRDALTWAHKVAQTIDDDISSTQSLDDPSYVPWHHAITMSGEGADIFPHRQQGVLHIAHTLSTLIKEQNEKHRLSFYHGHGELKTCHDVTKEPQAYASSNWHATARLAATWNRHASLLLLDIGSTTSDIIPIHHQTLLCHGDNDHTRLQHRELFYSGVIRTPLMACASHIRFDSFHMPVCAELFATSGDIYLYDNTLPPSYHHMPTSDHRGTSKQESIQRIARMIGCDSDTLSPTQQDMLVDAFQKKHLQALCNACLFVIKTPPFINYLMNHTPQAPHKPRGLDIWVTGCGHVLGEKIASTLQDMLSMPIRQRRLADIVLSSYACRATHATKDIDGKGGIDICAPAVALALLTAHHH